MKLPYLTHYTTERAYWATNTTHGEVSVCKRKKNKTQKLNTLDTCIKAKSSTCYSASYMR